MSHVVDRLVASKIVEGPDDAKPPRYSTDVEAAVEAANVFTRKGGALRFTKSGAHVWEVTASAHPNGRKFVEYGNFASALCRAMLASVGVSVMSSNES